MGNPRGEGRPAKQPELPSVRVERILRERIANGTYPPNSQLPTMDDLARELGTSRGTVANVLRNMPEVRVIPGYGSFVVGANSAD
jgi:DNA-binding GntR family transcriptional regulator